MHARTDYSPSVFRTLDAPNFMAEECVMHNDMDSPLGLSPTLTLPALALSFAVRQFKGHEALNQLYELDIELLGPAPAIALEQWLHQPAYLGLTPDTGRHGIVQRVGLVEASAQQIAYRLTLTPRLLALEQPPRRRVWHELSVPHLLHQLLEEHGLPADSYRFELHHGEYPPRALCIQYDETDLHLLHRLCEEEGIHFHFEHQHERHVLVFAEDSASFTQHPLETAFAPGASQAVIRQMFQCYNPPCSAPRARIQPGGDTQGSNPTATDAANQVSQATTRSTPTQQHQHQLSRRELERLRCLHRQVQGHSTQPGLRSGSILQVSGHPVAAFNDQWLLCEVEYQGTATHYSNQFTAIPWSSEFRPALNHPKPRIHGQQLARVAEPPVLDAQGRVEVWLWPSQTAGDAPSGLWLPRVQVDAGATPLPTGGSEVQVSFLDGDPDRPVLYAADLGATRADTTRQDEAHPISLSANGNVLHLTADSITLSGPLFSPTPAPCAPPPRTGRSITPQRQRLER
ncbi:type VI secretion system Vgr family protein [Pseudomonas sp. RA_35y_Pfl2_P32]|uniref:type VI secretion system Vgr family protein n=1 Tax=Pseudomonas sp. RA_35y_Pfl2_P32 TaxID=3088705 RepID=UPI0030DAFA1A